MNLYFRLFLVLLSEFFRKHAPVKSIEEVSSTLSFRCWFMDMDVNRHMNNARYLSFMDLGRLSLIHAAGLAPLARKKQWLPMVDGVHIQFFRGVKPLQQVRLESRVFGWTERHFFIEQKFVLPDGTVSAIAEVRTLFARPGGVASTSEVLSALAVPDQSPALTDDILRWHAELERRRLNQRQSA